MTLTDFADETASNLRPRWGRSPPRGPGCCLGSMVANLSSHKRGWDDRWEEFSDWAEKGKVYQTELTNWWTKTPMLYQDHGCFQFA